MITNNNIDPNSVYISFTGKDKAIVNKFTGMLQNSSIPYRVSIDDDIPSISDFEQEIGLGKIVVIFYSPDYFKSYHCMNEYALIRSNTPNNRVYTFRCEFFEFNKIEDDLIMSWGGKKALCKRKKFEDLTAEKKAA